MTRDKLQDKINSFGIDISIPETEIPTQFLTIELPSENIHQFISKLKASDTNFNYLFCQTGIDFPSHMEVLYHLRSTSLNHEIVVKAKIENRDKPIIDSVYDLYKTAEYHEREIFDLFGIHFVNHPDLRRIFLDDAWDGHPLRKDYIDEINIVEL